MWRWCFASAWLSKTWPSSSTFLFRNLLGNARQARVMLRPETPMIGVLPWLWLKPGLEDRINGQRAHIFIVFHDYSKN